MRPVANLIYRGLPRHAHAGLTYARVQPGQWKEMRLEGFLRTIICISPAILTVLVTHKGHSPHVRLRELPQISISRDLPGSAGKTLIG